MAKTDRRVNRTREQLQKALIELIGERTYDAITIQEIADRANIGRTTFYLHYNTKDDLFMNCHEAIITEFLSRPLFSHPLSLKELLSSEVPSGKIAAFRHLEEARTRLNSIFQGKGGPLILRRMRDLSAQEIEANLRAVFTKTDATTPFDVLANYLAGAQIALIQWWLEKRRSHTPEKMAQILHHLQTMAIREALSLSDSERGNLLDQS